MKLTVYYEDKNHPTILDVPDTDCEIWIEDDYQRRLSAAEDKSSVTRRTAQEIMDEDYNKPTFNGHQRETRRHVSLDALDPLGDTLVGSSNVESAGCKEDYADLHRAISRLKPKQRDLIKKVFWEDIKQVEIKDCEDGKIDLILTKSISRWGRNVVDNLNTVRRLKELGVGVKFEKEGIFTQDNTGEMLITILSSFAQQESDSISKNVRLGIQYLFQQGKGRLNTTQFLGLTKDPTDKHMLLIVPEEAALVRRIYREFLEGYSPGMIAARLTADEIKTPTGRDVWYASTITSILENEKYCGDLLMQKYYVVDFLNHKLVKNEGTLPQYFVEDHHEPIIPKEIYYQVQGELQRRSLLKNDPTKIRFGSRDALRGRLFCGKCGRTLKKYDGAGGVTWRCRKRAYTKQSITKEATENMLGCTCRIVTEKEVKGAIIEAFNQLPKARDELVRKLGALRDGEMKRIDGQIQGVQERQNDLNERLDETTFDGGGEETQFLTAELERLDLEYTRLVLERAEAANTEVHIRLLLELVDAMRGRTEEAAEDGAACYDVDEFFRRTSYVVDEGVIDEGKIISFSNDMVIRYLEGVTVLEDGYEVQFKAGLEVTVPAGK